MRLWRKVNAVYSHATLYCQVPKQNTVWVGGGVFLVGWFGECFFCPLFFFLREQTSECYILLKRTAHKRIANALHSRCLPCYKQRNAGKRLSTNIHAKHHK